MALTTIPTVLPDQEQSHCVTAVSKCHDVAGAMTYMEVSQVVERRFGNVPLSDHVSQQAVWAPGWELSVAAVAH